VKQSPIVIFAGETVWKLARGDSISDVIPVGGTAPAASNPDQLATAIAGMIGSVSRSVTLVVSAAWCLSATVPLAGVPARNRRSSLLYRLELLLPLTAEEIAADYVFNEPENAFAICVSAIALKPFVDALETAGISIQSITPASVYAVQSLLAGQKTDGCDLVIWQSQNTIELFVIRKGSVAGWYLFPAEADDLRWHLDQIPSSAGVVRTVIPCNLDPNLLAVLQADRSLALAGEEHRTIEQAVTSALGAGTQPAIELRRDALAPGNAFRAVRKPLMELAAATILLVFCICGAALWRAAKLERIASDDRDQQAALFRQVFPGHVVPVNIVSRLRSEARRIDQGSGSNAAAQSIQPAPPTLRSILVAISTMPADVRLEVRDLTVNDGHFSMDGRVRNRNDLNTLVDALANTAHLQLDPPQTEQDGARGLHITLTGALPAEPAPK
jgi:hypothetical protein